LSRYVESGLVQLVEAALRGIGQIGREAPAEVGQRRILGDVAHRAAHRCRAEQRALRTLDHFDALDLAEQCIEGEVRAFGKRRDRAVRNVVEIDADRRRREDVGDAAHRDRALPGRAAVVEVHAGHVLEHAAQRGESARRELRRIDHCDRRRHVLHFLSATRGRDDDFLDADLFRGIGRGGGTGQCQQTPGVEATHMLISPPTTMGREWEQRLPRIYKDSTDFWNPLALNGVDTAARPRSRNL
jgi:hypothetical protein